MRLTCLIIQDLDFTGYLVPPQSDVKKMIFRENDIEDKSPNNQDDSPL